MVTQYAEKLEGLWLQKAISLLLFFPLVWFLDPEKVLLLYIIFGHAHFGLTYWYQFKGGRVKPTLLTFASYAAILLGLFWMAYNKPVALMTFSSIFFVVHYYLDEFKINQEKLKLGLFLLVVPFIALLILALRTHEEVAMGYYATGQLREFMWGWDAYLGHHPIVLAYLAKVPAKTALIGYWPWIFGGLATAIGYYGLDCYRRKTITLASLYILLVTIGGMSILWFGGVRHVTSIFGFIILSHYTHWYISVYQKLRRFAPEKLPTYFKEIAIANAIVVGLYAYTVLAPEAPLAWEIDRWGYNFHAFMVWTALHLITTVRVDDYKTLFGKAGEKAALGLQAITRFR